MLHGSVAFRQGAMIAMRSRGRAGVEIIVDLRRLLLTGIRVKCQVGDRVLF
jgi:hypothetical protein